MEIAIWLIFSLLILAGFVGLFIPIIPGFILIATAVLLHKIFLSSLLSWWTVAFTFLLFGASYGIDLLGTVVGAKWGGASRVGMIGLVIGGFVGLFFGLPGILLGPLFGIFIGELINSRTVVDAVKASAGATAGIAISSVLKIFLAFIALAVILLDLFFFT